MNETQLIYKQATTYNLMPIDSLLDYAGPHNATTHADGVSDKYNFISTRNVLNGLDAKAWGVAEFKVMKANKNENHGFQKHMIKLQRYDQIGLKESQQIVLINSHNRSSGFRVAAGVFRLVCSNGLIVGNDYGFGVRHIGGSSDKVIDAVFRVVKDSDLINSRIDALKSVQLSSEAARNFASEALKLRFADEKIIQLGEQGLAYALHTKRTEDSGADLWTVFNRVQENLSNKIRVRGGRSIGGLKAIDSNIKFNKDLWTLAENTAMRAVL